MTSGMVTCLEVRDTWIICAVGFLIICNPRCRGRDSGSEEEWQDEDTEDAPGGGSDDEEDAADLTGQYDDADDEASRVSTPCPAVHHSLWYVVCHSELLIVALFDLVHTLVLSVQGLKDWSAPG